MRPSLTIDGVIRVNHLLKTLVLPFCRFSALVVSRIMNYTSAMKLLERITVEPGKCGGQPCIRGKRMRVTDLLELLSHGASHEEILADYSFLEPEDILAAIAYASRITDHVVLSGA